jgi:hypothetical protein
MGLLEALDFHNDIVKGKLADSVEVEYSLHSWGEIFPRFLGDREHSLAARFILTEFPFKLFSSSTPYDHPLPQKLCLTFRAPHEERRYSSSFIESGFFSHEIAREFAAFLSLVTRRRVFVGKQIRSGGLPIEDEVELYPRSNVQERQKLREIDPSEIYSLLANLQKMDRRIANGFVLAMRLYHSAIDLMYSEPEFSYLLLVACLEAVSSTAMKDVQVGGEEQFLDSRFSGWREISSALPAKWEGKLRDLLLKNEHRTFERLLKFVNEFVEPQFFSEKIDDAKPDHPIALVGSMDSVREFAKEYGIEYAAEVDLDNHVVGRRYVVSSPKTISQLERVNRDQLEQTLRSIYNARSRLIHEGTRLSKSIVFGLFSGLPVEAVAEIQEREESGGRIKIPPLLTFERLVSYSMLGFLSKQTK